MDDFVSKRYFSYLYSMAGVPLVVQMDDDVSLVDKSARTGPTPIFLYLYLLGSCSIGSPKWGSKVVSNPFVRLWVISKLQTMCYAKFHSVKCAKSFLRSSSSMSKWQRIHKPFRRALKLQLQLRGGVSRLVDFVLKIYLFSWWFYGRRAKL